MAQTNSSAVRGLRVLVVLLAIAAILGVAAASVSSAHAHLRGPADRCDICVTAHMSAVQLSVAPLTSAPAVHGFHDFHLTESRAVSRKTLVPVNRGPPSNL